MRGSTSKKDIKKRKKKEKNQNINYLSKTKLNGNKIWRRVHAYNKIKTKKKKFDSQILRRKEQ